MKYLQKVLSVAFILCMGISFVNFSALAQDITKCDYDQVLIGDAILKDEGQNFIFDFSRGGDGYTFKGPKTNPIYQQMKDAIEKGEEGEDGKRVALYLSLDELVCVTERVKQILSIKPNPVEKADYYAVVVCVPHSSDCWTMKIDKTNPLSQRVKDGTLYDPDKVYFIQSLGKSILYLEENGSYKL